MEFYSTCTQLTFKILTTRCMLINLLISIGMSTAKIKENFSRRQVLKVIRLHSLGFEKTNNINSSLLTEIRYRKV